MYCKSDHKFPDDIIVGKIKIIQEASSPPASQSPLEVDVDDPGLISDCPSNVSGLISPLNKDVFTQLFDEAALDPMSSDGELTEIANKELRRRIKEEPIGLSANDDLLAEAVLKAIRCSPPSNILVKEEKKTTGGVSNGVVASGQLCDWPGKYSFSLSVPDYSKPKDPQFSKIINKLFIGQNRSLVLQMSVDICKLSPIQTLSLKAEVVFTSPDHSDQVVGVCYQHSHNSQGRLRDTLANHILRMSAEGLESKYVEYTDSGRRSVVISHLPPTPPPGSSTFPVTIRFTDLGSCTGGINRRDTAVVFSLEREGGVVVGRKVIPVRVCTCPKRDRENEEKGESGVRTGVGKSPSGPSRGLKRKLDGKDVFLVVAYGRDNFEALCQVGQVLEKNRPGGDVDTWASEVEKMNRAEDKS